MMASRSNDSSVLTVPRVTVISTMRALVLDAYQFTRFAAIGFTIMLPLFGAASVTDGVKPLRILGLCALAVAFHLYAYVLNDVIDLEFDRLEPLRAADPLVRGLVSRGAALAIALAQVPIAFATVIALGGKERALGPLTVGLLGMTAYNLFGKRTGVPLVTDVVQGISWGCLVIIGAVLATGASNRLTIAVVGTVTVYIVFINGVHGALRDLGSDLAGGAHTMAIALGARPVGEASVEVPPALRSYVLVLQVVLLGAVGMTTATAWTRYTSSWRLLVATGLGVMSCGTIVLLAAAVRRVHDKWSFVTVGMVHLVVSLAVLILPLLPLMSSPMRLLVVAAYIAPITAMLARYGVRWG
jgi:4-hydroxybenzoate polyprenyltransferase